MIGCIQFIIFTIILAFTMKLAFKMKRRTATIKDVANKLGVSPSTVSRALKDHPEISKKTREAVKKVAHEMHYEPSSLALSLRFSKILYYRSCRTRKSSIFSFLLWSVTLKDVANANGYNVIINPIK